MSEELKPALSAEEWTTHRDLGLLDAKPDMIAMREGYSRHGLAAISLFGQPFGFSQEDVKALLEDATEWDDRSDIFAHRSARLRELASRIRALLPSE